jgi:hypothetical protein
MTPFLEVLTILMEETMLWQKEEKVMLLSIWKLLQEGLNNVIF